MDVINPAVGDMAYDQQFKRERLERIATDALQGMLANINMIDCHTTTALSIIADRAIECAEFMIEKIYDK